MNSVQRPNRDNQFDDLNRSTLHRQVTVQSPQPNSPAKKPAVICINVIILHSSASNVLHQYFSDQNPQSVSDFYLPTMYIQTCTRPEVFVISYFFILTCFHLMNFLEEEMKLTAF